MTHKELIIELAERLNWTQTRTSNVLGEAINVINKSLADEDILNIQGFGSFETKRKQERVSVNPITKQRFMVPPKMTINFRPSPIVKDKLKKIATNE